MAKAEESGPLDPPRGT